MNPVADIALEALGDAQLPFYRKALQRACQQSPPPYGHRAFSERFRRSATDPSWFAALLVSNVDLEGYSAAQLWSYARSVEAPSTAQKMRTHAADEARHSRLFARLTFTLFPHLDVPANRHRLASMAPDFSRAVEDAAQQRTFDELLDSVLLINLHEVKALILERLLRPLLCAYAEPESQQGILRIADRLILDEVEHIRYTAQLIERAAAEGYGDYITEAMRDFQEVLSAVTLDEVAQIGAGDSACID